MFVPVLTLSPLRGLSCSEYRDTSGASLSHLPTNPASLRVSVSCSSLHLSLRLPLALRLWPLQLSPPLRGKVWEPAIPQSSLPRSLCPSLPRVLLACVSLPVPRPILSVFLSVTSQPYPWPSSVPFHPQGARLPPRVSQSHLMSRSNLGSVACFPTPSTYL